jgi:hypothetical protein
LARNNPALNHLFNRFPIRYCNKNQELKQPGINEVCYQTVCRGFLNGMNYELAVSAPDLPGNY